MPVTSTCLTGAKNGVLERLLSLGSLSMESVVLMQRELRPAGSIYVKRWDVRLRA